ncbi:type IV pilin-like G/H family protein [Leptothermofonsia sp. ETS-13]|uniref:type IV pilin-like G/H family protein n=1 Tax=Leptothermofonsia sp. ETS-13 TaxID=3035696 RepID=UPI003BA098E7
MMTLSRHQLAKLGAFTALLLSACSKAANRSPFPTPPPPLPAETATPLPSPVVASPSPTPTVPIDAYQKGTDKAASATTLARDAQTPEDWKLVITQWERAIAFLKSVPRTNPDYPKAQKLLRDYQQQLANARQRAKTNPRQTTTVAKEPSVGGIPLLATSDNATAIEAMNTLNQKQTEFFNQKKRFASNLAELGSRVVPENPSYLYSTRGDERQAISTAIAKRDGLPSYTAAVFLVKDGNNNLSLSIVCASQQSSKVAPALPRVDGKQLKCGDGSSSV